MRLATDVARWERASARVSSSGHAVTLSPRNKLRELLLCNRLFLPRIRGSKKLSCRQHATGEPMLLTSRFESLEINLPPRCSLLNFGLQACNDCLMFWCVVYSGCGSWRGWLHTQSVQRFSNFVDNNFFFFFYLCLYMALFRMCKVFTFFIF